MLFSNLQQQPPPYSVTIWMRTYCLPPACSEPVSSCLIGNVPEQVSISTAAVLRFAAAVSWFGAKAFLCSLIAAQNARTTFLSLCSFFYSTAQQAFLRPDCTAREPARADAVKAGRCSAATAGLALMASGTVAMLGMSGLR